MNDSIRIAVMGATSSGMVDGNWATGVAISDIQSQITSQIPSHAIITSVALYVGAHWVQNNILFGGSNTYSRTVYFCNSDNLYSGDALTGTTAVNKDTVKYGYSTTIGNYIDKTYPFTINAPYTHLSIVFTEDSNYTQKREYHVDEIYLQIEYLSDAEFTLETTNTIWADDCYILLADGTNCGSSHTFYNGHEFYIYAKSHDGRKITGLEHYQDGTLVESLSASQLSSSLTEDGSVLQYKITLTESILNIHHTIRVLFDKIVYVTYDSCFNYYKWYYEGTWPEGVSQKNRSGYTIATRSGVNYSEYESPLMPVAPGQYMLQYNISPLPAEGTSYICCKYNAYNANQVYTSRGGSDSNRGVLHVSLSYAYYVAFEPIHDGRTDSVTTFSDFVLYPEGYDYMQNTVSSYSRTHSGKWNMPTPTREGYVFKGWNSKPDGSGKTYTSADPYPTEDLVLYSQWAVKPPVTIYVGQTQALRAYVGTQEIINIL